METLANCGMHACPSVPMPVRVVLGVTGVAAIVVTILELIRRRR